MTEFYLRDEEVQILARLQAGEELTGELDWSGILGFVSMLEDGLIDFAPPGNEKNSVQRLRLTERGREELARYD